jgi:hypothetical protein
MVPVEYSEVITRTPSTQIVSWPRNSPEPRMKPTGSIRTRASRSAALGPFQLATVSHVNSAVRPREIATNRVRVQTVERTERIFVHSALIRSRARVPLLAAGMAGTRTGAAGDWVVIGHSRPPGQARC